MRTNEPTPAAPVELAPGTEVEMISTLVALDAGRLRAYHALGGRPAGSVNGVDYFGALVGESARVIRQEGDAVHVRILGGPWDGREGWVARDGVRLPPAEAESPNDGAEALSLGTRREIYAATHAVGMKASALVDSRFPFDRMPADVEAVRRYLAEREALYKAARDQGRREVMERHQIDEMQLDRIEAEGRNEKWPPWDGLADERGPIPTFGPVRTDEQGRIVMTDEEWAARRDAAIRALDAVGKITDETDTDEVWDDVFRGLEEAR